MKILLKRSCKTDKGCFSEIQQVWIYLDMLKKHRQDCEHSNIPQFDIYAINSNFAEVLQKN